MMLWEALKTGRRIRRDNSENHFIEPGEFYLSTKDHSEDYWEVEPEPKPKPKPKNQRRVFLWDHRDAEADAKESWSLCCLWMTKEENENYCSESNFIFRPSAICPNGILEDVE